MSTNINGLEMATVKDACERLQLSRNTLLRYISEGLVSSPPIVRHGRTAYRYFPEEWFEQNIPKIEAARGGFVPEQTAGGERKQLRRSAARFTVPNADLMRAQLGASTSSLASASNVSRDTVMKVLREHPVQKHSCERIILGLKRLGHPDASLNDVFEDSP